MKLMFIPSILLLLASHALAQGLYLPIDRRIPIRDGCFIRTLDIDAAVRDQLADVRISQTIHNPGSAPLEASFVFPVPPDAVISQFTLMIDGREVPAKLYPQDQARQIYEQIVRTRRDPALLQYMGYGLLQTQVFPIPAGSERKITLKYTQLCRRDHDLTEFAFPLASGKLAGHPIESARFTARIETSAPLKSVYSPSYPISVERPGNTTAIIRWGQQGFLPADDLRILFSTSDQPIGATLLSYRPNPNDDGYFLLLATPQINAGTKILPKTVIFTLDRSGSMAGPKIEQARNALKFVMNNLREGDTFNIVVFDDHVESFAPELQRFNEELREKALRYIDSIHDGGSTNIDGAIHRSFELAGNTGRPTYVIFLTDGLPTTGELNESRIAEHARAWNRANARLFTFGLGFDVNARLLDRLSTENSGASEYVKPSENIESAVSRFYSRMTAPVMTSALIHLANAEINRIYPRQLPDLFAGQQLVAVGRYRNSGPTTIHLEGKVGDHTEKYEFSAALAAASADDTYSFVEKLWATRRVGEILNELDLHGKNQELIDELVRLATQHGILTPYTAFLANEETNLRAFNMNVLRAEREAFESKDALQNNQTGAAGVNLRMAKSSLQNQAYAPQQGQAIYTAPNGKSIVEDNCQVVGNQALFRRNNRWIDPSITPDDEKKAVQVEQFSDRYFELARTNARLRQYLALPEGCTVKVDGQVYQINASQDAK